MLSLQTCGAWNREISMDSCLWYPPGTLWNCKLSTDLLRAHFSNIVVISLDICIIDPRNSCQVGILPYGTRTAPAPPVWLKLTRPTRFWTLELPKTTLKHSASQLPYKLLPQTWEAKTSVASHGLAGTGCELKRVECVVSWFHVFKSRLFRSRNTNSVS